MKSRAQVCVEQTNKAICKKMETLLILTVEAHLHDFIKEQAARDEEIVTRALSALSNITGWSDLVTIPPPTTMTSIGIVRRDNSSAEYIVVKHAPLRRKLNSLTVNITSGLFRNQHGDWTEIEEIKSVAHMYSAVQDGYELTKWQRQFKDRNPNNGDESWSEAGLSRMCALSPNYRACLVNKGESWNKTEPARISIYKHGPRSRTVEPMPAQLAKALTVAANMTTEEA